MSKLGQRLIEAAHEAQAIARGQRIFVLTLRAASDDQSTIRELRWVLKALLRQHQLRCVDIQEITEEVREVKEQA